MRAGDVIAAPAERPDARYAVNILDRDTIAWCPNLELVAQAMTRLVAADVRRAHVVRLSDGIVVWPWMTRGGIA